MKHFVRNNSKTESTTNPLVKTPLVTVLVKTQFDKGSIVDSVVGLFLSIHLSLPSRSKRLTIFHTSEEEAAIEEAIVT